MNEISARLVHTDDAERIRLLEAEVQQLRYRVLKYSEALDESRGVEMLRQAPFDPTGFYGSRGYKLWMLYLKLYDLPVVGGALRGARAGVGKVVRAVRRLSGKTAGRK